MRIAALALAIALLQPGPGVLAQSGMGAMAVLSGGVGIEGRNEMAARRAACNLHVMFAAKRGA